MDYGVICAWNEGGPEYIVENARVAEDAGFSLFALGDSQLLFRELYASLGLLAAETDDIRLAPAVTNPVTRDPAVTASAMATVDEISGGRGTLGIASGDSAVFTLGKSPAKLAEMREAVESIRALTAGESIEYNGQSLQLQWVAEEYGGRDVPLYIAAEGPKTLHMTGKIADGVLLNPGLYPDLVEDAIERVEAGAREAGRDPADLDKWLVARSNVADTREAAVDEIKMALAGTANHAFRFTMEGKQVPEEHADSIRELHERYVPSQHVQPGESPNRQLVEELGLTEFLADRFAVVGTPDQCVERLETLGDIDGLDGVLMVDNAEEKRRYLRRMGEDVLPHLIGD